MKHTYIHTIKYTKSHGSLVGSVVLNVRQRFKPQIRHFQQNKIRKIFSRLFPFSRFLAKSLMAFSFLPKKCTLNAILCLFLKNVLPFKRVVCYILNNFNFLMVEGIAFYAPYKSRLLIMSCKADDFCLFIGLPISLFCGITLRKHYIIKATWSVI